MNGKRVGYAILALLAVLAIALSAATLTDTQEVVGGDGPGTESEGDGPLPEVDDSVDEYGWIMYILVVVVVLIAIGVLLGALQFPLETIREFGRTLLAATVVVTAILVVGLLMEDGPLGQLEFFGGSDDPGNGGFGGGGDEAIGSEAVDAVSPVGPDASLLVILLVGLLAVGALGLLVRRQRRTGGTPSEENPDEAALAAIGASAGQLADRLEASVTVDNEVYRAWKEMTEHLDPHRPEVLTPAEFGEAAVGAGMEPADVERLTELFEEVRYGGASPTEAREAQAIEALRRIERRYAGAEGRYTGAEGRSAGAEGRYTGAEGRSGAGEQP